MARDLCPRIILILQKEDSLTLICSVRIRMLHNLPLAISLPNRRQVRDQTLYSAFYCKGTLQIGTCSREHEPTKSVSTLFERHNWPNWVKHPFSQQTHMVWINAKCGDYTERHSLLKTAENRWLSDFYFTSEDNRLLVMTELIPI